MRKKNFLPRTARTTYLRYDTNRRKENYGDHVELLVRLTRSFCSGFYLLLRETPWFYSLVRVVRCSVRVVRGKILLRETPCPPWFLLFLLLPICIHAQTRTDAPYLIPQTIFVGDPGRLIVPIGRAYARVEPFVWDKGDKLSETPDLVIRRIELERRGGVSRVLIDFIAYAPGTLILPPIEFPSQEAAIPTLSGLEVQVASILDPSQMILTEPASPLAVPGTSLLVYGTLVFVLLLLAMGIAVSFWGRRHFRVFFERLRRKYLLRSMRRFLRRLNRECRFKVNSSKISLHDKNLAPTFYLTRLSTEFREFLTQFTGVNCRSLTAVEFREITFDELSPRFTPGPDYLCDLFRSWDILRFSGRGMEMADLFVAMVETEKLISTLDRAESESIVENLIPEQIQERL